MALKNGIYIIECISKGENLREGVLLYEFLNMIIPEKIELHQVKGKSDFFNILKNNNSKVVHISCHGDEDDNGNFCMLMPKGKIYPEEFYNDDGLRNRNVLLTGCLLGRADFTKEFLDKTQAESIISPLKKIEFSDSAMWCLNFYYHLLTRNSFSFGRSFDYMSNNFYVPGAMQMWER